MNHRRMCATRTGPVRLPQGSQPLKSLLLQRRMLRQQLLCRAQTAFAYARVRQPHVLCRDGRSLLSLQLRFALYLDVLSPLQGALIYSKTYPASVDVVTMAKCDESPPRCCFVTVVCALSDAGSHYDTPWLLETPACMSEPRAAVGKSGCDQSRRMRSGLR